ncbi:hypothetical protein, partial [Natrinema hispanicum]
GGGTFGDIVESGETDDVSIGGAEYDTPDDRPGTPISGSQSAQATQSDVDREIQRILESDTKGISAGPAAGKETAIGIGQDGLPETGAQQFIADVQERGREYNRQEGEQFGDFEWQIAGYNLEKGARDFQEGAREAGGNVGSRVATLVPDAIGAAGAEQAADEIRSTTTYRTTESFYRGAGEGVGTLVGGLPVIGMEATETAEFTASNPREAAEQTPDALAGSAVETSRQFREDPARALGSTVAQTALSAGIGRGASAVTRSGRLSSTAAKARRKVSDIGDDMPSDRGQLGGGRGDMISRRGRGDQSDTDTDPAPSDADSVLPDNIDEMLEDMERGTGVREANQRAERSFIDDQLEAGRRQERGDEPATVDTRPGGDYTAPDRGGDYVADRSPDTSRSGPTDAQSSTPRSVGLDSDLSPRESQLAARLGRETPDADLRGVDETRRLTPGVDLREVGSSTATSSRSATAAGGAVGVFDPVGEMEDLRTQAEQSGVRADDSPPTGTGGVFDLPTLEDTEGLLTGIQDNRDDILGPEIEPGESTATGTGTRTGQTPDVGTQPDVGTAIGTLPGVATDTDARAGTDTDTRTRTDTDTRLIVGPDQEQRPPRDRGRPRDPDRPWTPGDSDRPIPPNNRDPPYRTPSDRTPPRDRDRPPRIRTPDLYPDADDDDDDEFLFGTAAVGYTFDFGDPLTGETLETDTEDSGSASIPGLGGMV